MVSVSNAIKGATEMTENQNNLDAVTLMQKIRQSLGVQESETVSSGVPISSSTNMYRLLPLNSLWAKLLELWQQGCDRPITSHRKGLSGVVIGLKKISKPLVEFPLSHRIQAQRDMDTMMVQMLGSLKENMEIMSRDLQELSVVNHTESMLQSQQQMQTNLNQLQIKFQQTETKLVGELQGFRSQQQVQEEKLSKLGRMEQIINSDHLELSQLKDKKKEADDYFYTQIISIKQDQKQFQVFRESTVVQLAEMQTILELNQQNHDTFKEQFAVCWNEIQKLIGQYNEVNKGTEFSQQIQSVFERMFQFHEKSLKQLQEMDVRLDEINYRVDNFFMTLDKKSLDLELQLEKMRTFSDQGEMN
jgi:hypothetical protein